MCGGVLGQITGCARQFPGETPPLTHSPGMVYMIKLIQGSALLPPQPQETGIPAPLVNHSFWELHREEQERVFLQVELISLIPSDGILA